MFHNHAYKAEAFYRRVQPLSWVVPMLSIGKLQTNLTSLAYQVGRFDLTRFSIKKSFTKESNLYFAYYIRHNAGTPNYLGRHRETLCGSGSLLAAICLLIRLVAIYKSQGNNSYYPLTFVLFIYRFQMTSHISQSVGGSLVEESILSRCRLFSHGRPNKTPLVRVRGLEPPMPHGTRA